LTTYFNTDAASAYKNTRNNLTGENFSTGFSPWLAQGCVSPLQIFEQLSQYEAAKGANESTGWILFELMWREFFRWHADHHGAALFAFTGITGQRPLTTFYRERFLKWREGATPWPIVNACMNELKETGWLSNRGRQLVASCLVNELGLDWRCGAGYFEEQLVDYDVSSNWGNWQYIAGVGSDPRGGRHFNLEKQAETWDSQGIYQQKWAGKTASAPLDSLDYYDWPAEIDAGLLTL
jgi:deoxyribodipyrimidine photo-lyase